MTNPSPRAIYLRKWRSKNIESARASGLKWYHAHKAQALKISKRWKKLNRSKVNLQASIARLRNLEKIRSRQRECYHQNRATLRAYQKRWRREHLDHVREQARRYYHLHKTKRSESARIYRKFNPEKCKAAMLKWRSRSRKHIKDYVKNRLKTNIQFKLRTIIASRILGVLRRNNAHKRSSTVALLGMSIPDFRHRLESLWSNGMTWNNHGNGGWHIDHIQPCSSFDLTDPEQQKKCFNWSNLQPLWWKDNLTKSDKVLLR